MEFSVIKQPAQSPSPAAGRRSWERSLSPLPEATLAGRQVGREVALRGGSVAGREAGQPPLMQEVAGGARAGARRAPGYQPVCRAFRSGFNPMG